MANYDLDVAFSSDTTPNDPTLPIAMAYGFTHPDGHGIFRGHGQTKETVPPGNTVYFYVYDTASNPTYNIVSVQISSINKAQGANAVKSPFAEAAWANGLITAVSQPNPNQSSQVQLGAINSPALSTGCNVKGVSWGIGPFTVVQLQGQQRFEFTVTVLMQNAQQAQKTFIVDPEVVVGSENR